MAIPNQFKQTLTQGVMALCKEDGSTAELYGLVIKAFGAMPDNVRDGGNDKSFFTVFFRNTKLFVAANEVNGLTVMLPEEY